LIGQSNTSTTLYLNVIRNRTILSHGKYLRQLTTSSTTLSALISYLESTWTSIIEEYIEFNKVKSEAISSLQQFIDEEPRDPPPWWNENMKTDVEGAMLCLLLTGVSEPGIIKWFEEKFATVVSIPAFTTDTAKCQKMAETNSRWLRCDSHIHSRTYPSGL
jgi:hypothetical protein